MTDNQDHAQAWAAAITNNTDAVLALFADALVYDDKRNNDHVTDTAITKEELRPKLAPFANADKDNGLGIHHFEVLDTIDSRGHNGARAVAILWQWTAENLQNYRGIPTQGKSLSTRGQTWHQFDSDGLVDRESTFWNDVPVFQELGIPAITPRYWDADFDPSSLG